MEKQAEKTNLRALTPYAKGVSFDVAFQLVKERGVRIISNREADRILVETDVWKSVREAFPIWTGTMTAYAEPGKTLGSTVEYTDSESKLTWVLDVPSGFRKLTNSILVAEYPHYEFERKGDRIIVHPESGKLTVVENFPTVNGVYAYDENTRIPINQKMECDSGNKHRHLWRLDKRVGPVARGNVNIGCDYGRRDVGLYGRPSDRLGVVGEVQEAQEVAQKLAKLQLAEGMAADATPELKRLAETTKPEAIEKLSELIRALTGQTQ